MGALAVAALVTLSGSALGAPGDLDPSETVEIEDQNDTVTVDVEFNDSFVNSTTYEGETFAYLELTDPNGTVVKSHNLTVNGSDLNTTQIAVDSDTVWFTQSFSDFDKDDVGNLTVELADHGDGLNDTVVSVDSGGLFGGGGILGGASQTQVLAGVIILVLGLIVFRRMDG
jgi:hypothetical protein